MTKDKWGKIDEQIKDAIVESYRDHGAAIMTLAGAVDRAVAILHGLDDDHKSCDQMAEWRLISTHSDFTTYSCTIHLPLMAGSETGTIKKIKTSYGCCYRE